MVDEYFTRAVGGLDRKLDSARRLPDVCSKVPTLRSLRIKRLSEARSTAHKESSPQQLQSAISLPKPRSPSVAPETANASQRDVRKRRFHDPVFNSAKTPTKRARFDSRNESPSKSPHSPDDRRVKDSTSKASLRAVANSRQSHDPNALAKFQAQKYVIHAYRNDLVSD